MTSCLKRVIDHHVVTTNPSSNKANSISTYIVLAQFEGDYGPVSVQVEQPFGRVDEGLRPGVLLQPEALQGRGRRGRGRWRRHVG